jgi:6-phospho-3-hexuloisomerase
MSGASSTLARVGEEIRSCLAGVDPGSIERALDRLQGAARVFVAGAGRSGFMVRGFAMRLMHAGKTVHVVGDPTTPAILCGDLLVIGSGSGRTASLLAMARKARDLGAGLLLYTIDSASPIAALADVVVVIPAPSPKVLRADPAAHAATTATVQPMGSLFEQSLLLVLDVTVLLLMERLGLTGEAMFERHANLE